MERITTNAARLRQLALILVAVVVLALIFIIAVSAYFYANSPPVIRNPYFQHYHFRLQIIVDGKPVNFADAKFQTGSSSVSCDAKLPAAPIHFHDNKNQIVHIHWDGMTGGLLLKDYGWNYIGGINGVLGYRFDKLPKLIKVPIHGNALPAVAKGDNFYVYIGDENSYKTKTFNDFLSQDFETFFGHKSDLPSSKPTSLLDQLIPHAYAEGLTTEQLTRLNNLIGNAVIFVQKDTPSAAAVKDRFNHLEPLSDSVCGS